MKMAAMVLEEEYKCYYTETLAHLTKIPSRSSPEGGEEGEIQKFIAEEMSRFDIHPRLFEASDVPDFFTNPLCFGPERNYSNRPTVIGEIGDKNAPALLIVAHSDTVQIPFPDQWTFSPFDGKIADGKIHGLGTSDDKWGVATILTIIKKLNDSKVNLKKRLIFASTIDEEHGVGNGLLLLKLAGIKAESALYLDGVDSQILIGNLGGSNLHLNPLSEIKKDLLDDFAERLEKKCADLSQEREILYKKPYYELNSTRKSSVRFDRVSYDRNNDLIINFYILPDEDRKMFCEYLEKSVKDVLGNNNVKFNLTYDPVWFESAFVDADLPLVRSLKKSFKKVSGIPAQITTLSKQDAFVLTNHAGIPTVSFGPAREEGPCTYHQPNENVDIDKAWQCCNTVYDVILKWIGDNSCHRK